MRKLIYVLAVGLVIVLLSGSGAFVDAQQNLRAKSSSPLLGWSSWSYIRAHPTAAKIEAQARALHKSGLQKLGYKYINQDGRWYKCSGKQGPDVDHYGRWVTNSSRFPARGDTNGIKVVADYVHSLGLKFGIYVTPGISRQAVSKNTSIKGTPYTADQVAEPSIEEANYNCGGMVGINFKKPGAQAYINSWVDMFAKWGVDYIKIDGIRNSNVADIKAWSRAIQQSGRPMVLDITQGSFTQAIALTLIKYANQWVFTPDIECHKCEKGDSSYPLTSWANIDKRFDAMAEFQPYAGPGGFNDYDAIEVGNGRNDGLTLNERKTQLSLWAMASAPLILGVDLTHLNKQDLKLLKNTAVIAVDQDGIAAKRLRRGWGTVFAKMEPNGDAIVGLFNTDARGVTKISIKASAVGIPKDKRGYSLENLWTGKKEKTSDTIRAKVPPHGVGLYRVKQL